MRITIHVRPGAGRPGVGGGHDGALIVRVTARAVGGQATEAALAAVADAFGVRRRAVTLVTGSTKPDESDRHSPTGIRRCWTICSPCRQSQLPGGRSDGCGQPDPMGAVSRNGPADGAQRNRQSAPAR